MEDKGLRDSGVVSQQGCYRKYRVRGVRSKGAVVVLAWTFLSSITVLNLPIPNRVHTVLNDVFLISLVKCVVIVTCCPLAGWLADVHFGRYKVMMASVWLMWCGGVVTVLALLIDYKLLSSVAGMVVNYVLVWPASIMTMAGFGAYIINAIPFGVDQMPGSSGEEVSAFIHWFIWSWYGGGQLSVFLHDIIHSDCTHFTERSADLVASVITVAIPTAILCSNILYQEWFMIEPQSQNPLKSIVSVLKYTVKHQRPAMRSALTYWEEDIPTRINLGKAKYGGPFTTEQVEDVKTFWRILAVIASMCIFLLFASAVADSSGDLIDQFRHATNSVSCSNTLMKELKSETLIILISIPVYELVVYPLARNWIPNMLKRVGIGAILMISITLFLLTANAVEHSRSSVPVPCMFVADADSPTFGMDSTWVEIPYSFVNSISILLFFIPMFEFIYAQAPYSMKGFLTGITWAVIQFSFAISDCLVYTAWYNGWKRPFTNPSCGVWYYVFLALIGILGIVILCVVAKWYPRRQRDEPVNERVFVEDYFDRYM